jgi:hypothetical protein
MLSIRLLGPPEASLKGHPPLRFGRKKSLALLYYLAAEGRRHPRSELAELLWPGSDEHHARTDLRSALAKLRKTLGEDSAHGDTHEEGVRFLVVDGAFLGIEPRDACTPPLPANPTAPRDPRSSSRTSESPFGARRASPPRSGKHPHSFCARPDHNISHR